MELIETIEDSFAFIEKLGLRGHRNGPYLVQYEYPALPAKGRVKILGDLKEYYYIDMEYTLLGEFSQQYRMNETFIEIGLLNESRNFLDHDRAKNAYREIPVGVTFAVIRTTNAVGCMYFNKETYCKGNSIVLRDEYCRRVLFPIVHSLVGTAVDEYSLLQTAGSTCTSVWGKILSELTVCPYNGNAAKLFLDAKLSEVMAALTNALENLDQSKIPMFTAYERNSVEQIKEYLQENITAPPSVKQLARNFSINPNKLQAAFKHYSGVTVMEYLRSYRLGKALELLAQGLLLEEIARQVGYKSASRFSEAFVKAYGILPSHYRKLIRNP